MTLSVFCVILIISIHPPREGWDTKHPFFVDYHAVFQSTHPVRGGTFYSLLLAVLYDISIHPPREGWDRRWWVGK